MHNDSQARIFSKVREVFIGMKDTNGGSIDTELKVPTTMASTEPSSPRPVTTTTPVG